LTTLGFHSSTPAEVLIRACTGIGEPEAWEEFIHRYNHVILAVVFRTACHWGEPSRSAMDDLVQETYLKLCANGGRLLREFEFRHSDSLFGFLKVVAASVVNDYFKSLNTVKRGAGMTSAGREDLESIPATNHADPLSPTERGILLNEIDDLLRSRASEASHERDRTIFWLYYRQGFTARAIASIPSVGLSAKGVESTILRLTRLVRENLAEPRGKAQADEREEPAVDRL
jgi:RNA polymerase sigma-70 factor (ECF subfamily)